MDRAQLFDRVYGCLTGGLIGDAMGAPSEGMTWQEIEKEFGKITDFEGAGTDDSAIKQILCEAIIDGDGYVTADEFAEAFLRNKAKYYPLFYIPVRNMFHKIESKLALPVDAGYGNMHSSSSAMSIAPMGIINACNPRQAAVEAFDAAGLIHAGPSGFCRDAACAVAAAIAEGIKPDATVESVVDASAKYLHPTSAAVMRDEIARNIAAARKAGSYEVYRDWFYQNCLRDIISDSRETVPCALALFLLAEGDVERCVVYAANIGRDADTIGTMVGAIAGAYKGISGIRRDWVDRLEANNANPQQTSKTYDGMESFELTDQKQLAEKLTEVVLARAARMAEVVACLS